jgi:hypothetical protein
VPAGEGNPGSPTIPSSAESQKPGEVIAPEEFAAPVRRPAGYRSFKSASGRAVHTSPDGRAASPQQRNPESATETRPVRSAVCRQEEGSSCVPAGAPRAPNG